MQGPMLLSIAPGLHHYAPAELVQIPLCCEKGKCLAYISCNNISDFLSLS